jgi:hypothetical protein
MHIEHDNPRLTDSRDHNSAKRRQDMIGEHADLVVEPARKHIECDRLATYYLARMDEHRYAGLNADAEQSG